MIYNLSYLSVLKLSFERCEFYLNKFGRYCPKLIHNTVNVVKLMYYIKTEFVTATHISIF